MNRIDRNGVEVVVTKYIEDVDDPTHIRVRSYRVRDGMPLNFILCVGDDQIGHDRSVEVSVGWNPDTGRRTHTRDRVDVGFSNDGHELYARSDGVTVTRKSGTVSAESVVHMPVRARHPNIAAFLLNPGKRPGSHHAIGFDISDQRAYVP